MSELAFEIAKVEVPPSRTWVDVVVACEPVWEGEADGLEVEDGEDVDIPIVSVIFR